MSVRNWGNGKIITEWGSARAFAEDAIPWRVSEEPLFAMSRELGETGKVDTGHKAIIRHDGDMLANVLGVVGSKYKFLQPQDMLVEHVWPYIQAGAIPERVTELGGGARIAVQLRLPEEARIGGTDIRPLLTYADSFDGSASAFYADICQVVVCENTYAMAHAEVSSRGISRVRHSSNAEQRMREVAQDLGERLKNFKTVEVPKLQTLWDRGHNISEQGYRTYVGEVLDVEPDSRTADKLHTLWRSVDLIGITGNDSWDAFQSVTQYLGHEAGRSAERRAWDTTAGAGAVTGQRALQLAIMHLT